VSRESAAARRAVLVADDQLNVRNILEFNLRRRGFDVRVVHDGPSVLAAVSAAAPDLILLDIMMPGLDGFGVLERLRVDPATARIPVLVVSARGAETDILKALQLGAVDYVVKPFNLEVLFEKIRRAVEAGGPPAPAGRVSAAAAAILPVESLDAEALPGVGRRAVALAHAGARTVVLDLSSAPPPDRAAAGRLARLRDEVRRAGATLVLAAPAALAEAIREAGISPAFEIFADAAAAIRR
jgi:CheY-like chemotaxis protein/anti-anti-sigma regulatory factor